VGNGSGCTQRPSVTVRETEFARTGRTGGLVGGDMRWPGLSQPGTNLTETEMNLDTLPDMLSVEEAATVLRISRSRAYEEAAIFQRTNGGAGLPSIRIGRSLRVPKRALIAWIDQKLGGAETAA